MPRTLSSLVAIMDLRRAISGVPAMTEVQLPTTRAYGRISPHLMKYNAASTCTEDDRAAQDIYIHTKLSILVFKSY